MSKYSVAFVYNIINKKKKARFFYVALKKLIEKYIMNKILIV